MNTFIRKIFRYPLIVVGVIFAITVFFALQLPRAQLDNNNLRFVPKGDAARQTSEYIDDTFGSSLFILVGLERQYGTVFDKEFLERIKAYIDRIAEIEIVGEINSIMNTDYIMDDDGTILVKNLVDDGFSGTSAEIAELKRRLVSWDMYKRSLVSDDFTSTQIYVPLTISTENAGDPEVVASYLVIRDIAREMFSDVATVYVAGLPVISGSINESMRADLMLLIPLVIVVVLLVLFLPLRRISFVALALLSVLLAVIWSVGAMPLFGVRLSVISTVLPVILIAVGSSYGLHLIIHYIEGSGKDFSSMTRAEHTEFVLQLVETLGKAIFLAAITTFVSFLSFCFTQVLPIREFGYFSAFGVLASFLIAITLTPSLLILRGPKALHRLRVAAKPAEGAAAAIEAADGRTAAARAEGAATAIETAGGQIAAFFARIASHPKTVLFFTAIIVIFSIYGTSKLVIDNIFVEYFRKDTDIVKSDEFIREKFGGSKVISVVVQADSPEILLHPATLGAVDGLNQYLMEKVEGTGKVMGFTDLVKRINQVFNADESPNGLKPAAASASGGSSFGFGFGSGGGDMDDSFGFGSSGDADDSFGFGSSGDTDDSFGFGSIINSVKDALATVTDAVSGVFMPAEPEDAYLDKPATPRELAALLDIAAGNGPDVVLEFKKIVNYEGAAYYEVPIDPAKYGKTAPQELQMLVSNYLVLLSGNISSYANDPLEPTAIKSTVQLRTIGQKDTDRVVDAINEYVKANFPENVRVVIGGAALVEASTNLNVVQSVWSSLLIAIVSMFIIITVSNRSFIAGLIAVITLGALILLNFAIMGLVGIKINIGTALIASLTMGIGIDYTIHFIEAYKREYQSAGGKGGYLERAYRVSGMAIITDAVSVSAGFAVLLLSKFTMLAEFGLLVAVSMLLSALAGLILVPSLLLLFKPKFVEQKQLDEPRLADK